MSPLSEVTTTEAQLGLGLDILQELGVEVKHHGIKGMKWGVRRSQEELSRDDKKWLKKTSRSAKQYMKVYDDMAKAMNTGGFDTINKKYENPNGKGPLDDFEPDGRPTARQQAYLNEVSETCERHLNESAKRNYPDSPSGRFGVEFVYRPERDPMPVMVIVDRQEKDSAQHADTPAGTFEVKLQWKDGFVTQVEMPDVLEQSGLTLEEFLEHSETSREEFIQHYGVKGMKWGVRRSQAELERSRISSMSDEELSAVVKRMRLENDYRAASKAASTSAGREFLRKYGNQVGSIAVGALASTGVALLRTALTARFG